MSLSIKDTKATVWQYDSKERYGASNLSTSKKDKDGNWINMNWRARYVGEAFQKASELVDKTRILITNGIIEQSKVEDKYYYNIVIFDFDYVDNVSNQSVHVQHTTDDDLPF